MKSTPSLLGLTGSGRAHAAGFSLIEVMVAVIIIGVGLLGVEKMQALAISSTTVASQRALAAQEAASLAATMRANRAYWSASAPAVPITLTATTVATADTALGPELGATAPDPNYCINTHAPCSPIDVAAYDLNRWAAALNQLLPNPTATINCQPLPAPLTCTIQISWSEKAVGINNQEAQNEAANEAAGGPGFDNPTYTLYVEP